MPPPTIVEARVTEQCGFPVYVGRCPKCGHEIALDSQGRVICRCGLHLRFIDPKNPVKTPGD